MYSIVVGAGSIGSPLIEIATGDRNEVVVIERHHEKAERAATEFDYLVIEADATAVETLEDAGIDRGETTLEVGDLVPVYSATGATPDVTDVFGHYEVHGS